MSGRLTGSEVYHAQCRQKICACHLPHELCECTCALCKARRWERITHKRVEPYLSPGRRQQQTPVSPLSSTALPPVSPLTPTNRELAERALSSGRRASSERNVYAVFLDALQSPPTHPSLEMPSPAPAYAQAHDALDASPPPGPSQASPKTPVSVPAPRSLSRAQTWPSPERQFVAQELEVNKVRAQAEAALAVKVALDFITRHASAR